MYFIGHTLQLLRTINHVLFQVDLLKSTLDVHKRRQSNPHTLRDEKSSNQQLNSESIEIPSKLDKLIAENIAE